MPTRRPPPIPRLGGVGDFLEDAGNYIVNHGDEIASVAEVVVPLIAPAAAPVVAAEHALRTGMELSAKQAKAATQGATAVGQAVAQHVADQAAAGDPAAVKIAKVSPPVTAASQEETSETTRDSQELADPRKGKGKSSSGNSVLLVAAVILGLIVISGELE